MADLNEATSLRRSSKPLFYHHDLKPPVQDCSGPIRESRASRDFVNAQRNLGERLMALHQTLPRTGEKISMKVE